MDSVTLVQIIFLDRLILDKLNLGLFVLLFAILDPIET